MADERKMGTVQCFEESKVQFDRAAKVLRWTMPQVMELLGEALDVMLVEEETVEERKRRMLAKLGAGSTGVRQRSNKSVTSLPQESHNGSGLVEVAS